MSGTAGLLKVIQNASQSVTDASVPSNVVYGNVETINPVSVKVREDMIIPSGAISMCQTVTDYETTISVTGAYDWNTQPKSGGTGESSFEEHDHEIILSKKKIKIHNALKVGDKVAMVRLQGGQSYLILDKVVTQ